MKNLSYLMDHILYNNKHETVTDNSSVIVYINKIENRITFKIKTGYYPEPFTPETMKLLGSTKSEITKDNKSEIVSCLEITEVVLMQCNIVSNDYQQDSRFLYTFIPNKSFGQLLDISQKKCIFLKPFNSEFSYIEVSFAGQNSKPLERGDKINITIVVN